MWIFGYGSLVWKVDFPFTQKMIGYIKGYERKFWQASIDHRGTPDKPGRVVTLVPSTDPEAKVYGVAYEIPEDDKTVTSLNTREKRFDQMRIWGAAYKLDESNLDEILRQLDHREVMGYEKVPVQFHPIPSHPLNQLPSGHSFPQAPFQVTMYYGSRENEHFVEAPLDELAHRIWESVGPSGANKEYLFNLCDAMKQIEDSLPTEHAQDKDTIVDSHLKELESAVKALDEWTNQFNEIQ